ncbi:uncharacterized protein AB675_10656 [Cyphellophora attinorum]|uniref:BTB domain-containing protein n=1 Tax=Cyphellophora attinorum TaxID=1664694 RepID=A0A0N1P1I8_9EURO|nr:uncharacterized protein AB675_10656 [Phialophora attinorum]KPI40752.1 hypothetical protein AB675_10656 [Phialophora attinorum]
MLENGMKESTTRRVIFEDISSETFRLVLEFAYTNMYRLERPIREYIDRGEGERPRSPPPRRASEEIDSAEVDETIPPPPPRRRESYRSSITGGVPKSQNSA